MITTSQYKYKGSFVDNAGHTIRMEIESPYLTEDKTFIFGPDPLHITWDNDDIFDGATGRKMTAQIVFNDLMMFEGLMPETPLGVSVKCYKDDVLFWYGFLSDDEYDMTYSSTARTGNIDIYDPILVCDNIPYTHTKTERRKLLKILDLTKMYCDAVGIENFYIGNSIDKSILFGEDAFLPDGWEVDWTEGGSWKKWSEVLKGVGQTFGANFFVIGNILYMLPIQNPKQAEAYIMCSMFTKGNSAWSETTSQKVFINAYHKQSAMYDFKNNMLADSSSVTIQSAKSHLIKSVDVSETRSIIPNVFDDSRWNGDKLKLSGTLVSTRTLSEEDDKRIVLEVRNKPATDTSIPYCYDWYGTFGIIKKYKKETVGSTVNLTEESREIAAINIYTRDCAAKTTPVTETFYEDGTGNNLFLVTYDQDLAAGYPSISATIKKYDGTEETKEPYKVTKCDGNSFAIERFVITPGSVAIHLNAGSSLITSIKFEDSSYSFVDTETRMTLNTSSFKEKSISTMLGSLICAEFKGCCSSAPNLTSYYQIFSKPIRTFSFSTITNEMDIWPFTFGQFNGYKGMVVGADIDLYNFESDLNLMSNDYLEPEPETWYLVSLDALVLQTYSRYEVPGSGGRYELPIRVVCTLSNGTTTKTYNGTTTGLRQDYGIFLYPVLHSRMEIAHEEADPRAYTISGGYITIDEWPLSEIDERWIYVWATCNNLETDEVEFYQAPNYDDEL